MLWILRVGVEDVVGGHGGDGPAQSGGGHARQFAVTHRKRPGLKRVALPADTPRKGPSPALPVRALLSK
jgi:hypothetical protein